MPASDAQLLELVRGYQTTTVSLAARTAEQIGTLWDLEGGLDDRALERFSTSAAGTVRAAQVTAAGLSVAYIRNYVTLAGADPLDLDGLDLDELAATARAGVDPTAVYARPVITARAGIASGATFAAASATARARATSTAQTDVALAARRGTFDAMGRARDRVVGYRRVPRSNACTFCKVASTQRYHVRDLMPLHSHCHCAVAPIVGERDPGRVIDQRLRNELRLAADREDYWNDPKAAIAVERHGELGPVLVHAGDHFTGPRDLAA